MTAQYIAFDEDTEKSNLVTRVLKLEEMEAGVSKTADVVHERIFSVLSEFDLQDHVDKIVFCSDRGKNIVNACDGYTRQSCLDHFINNLVGEMIKEIDSMRIDIIKVIISQKP